MIGTMKKMKKDITESETEKVKGKKDDGAKKGTEGWL